MGPAYLETRTVLLGVAVTLKTNLRCGAYVAKDGFLVKDGLLHGQEIRPCLIKNENLSTSSFHMLIYINDVGFSCQSVMIFLTHMKILINHSGGAHDRVLGGVAEVRDEADCVLVALGGLVAKVGGGQVELVLMRTVSCAVL